MIDSCLLNEETRVLKNSQYQGNDKVPSYDSVCSNDHCTITVHNFRLPDDDTRNRHLLELTATSSSFEQGREIKSGVWFTIDEGGSVRGIYHIDLYKIVSKDNFTIPDPTF